MGSGTPGATQNQGLDIIGRLLTTPRPGGMPGSSNSSNNQTIGGGIAGVASKYEADSIKVYKERQKYNEWEFIYDIKEELQKMVPGGATPQQNQNRNPLGDKPTGNPDPNRGRTR